MPPSVQAKGPLPARVYWIRRAIVLGVPLLLIVVIARFLGGSSDARDPEQATQASASTATTGVIGPTAPAASAGKKGKKHKKNKRALPPEPVLAEPSGACTNNDVVVTPAITTAPGGGDVPITLNLRTRETAACTWTASADTLTVTITSGEDHIWSSRECPSALVPTDVVVRQAVDTPIVVTWNARRSKQGCTSPSAPWARPGWYHVEAAAWAGEPTDVQFELVAPSAPVITKTVEPEPQKKTSKKTDDTSHQPGEDGEGNSEG